jgi:hypothetical protein
VSKAFTREISHLRAPDLHPRMPRITAHGVQTRQHYAQEDQRRDMNRGLLLAILWQAAMDYHQAKNKIKAKDAYTEDRYWNLAEWDRDIIDDGKKAWEWFTQPSVVGVKHKYSYQEICRYFNVNPEKLWKKIKSNKKVGFMLGEFRSAEGNMT